MRVLVTLFLLVVLVVPSFAAISAKGGLAGGAFRIAAVMDKPVRDNVDVLGELGYGFGSGYSLLTVGVSGKTYVRNNLYLGAGVNYSSYTEPVKLSIGGDITDKSGVGFGVFAGMNVREGIYAQVGYDTRLGGIAEAGYTIKK